MGYLELSVKTLLKTSGGVIGADASCDITSVSFAYNEDQKGPFSDSRARE